MEYTMVPLLNKKTSSMQMEMGVKLSNQRYYIKTKEFLAISTNLSNKLILMFRGREMGSNQKRCITHWLSEPAFQISKPTCQWPHLISIQKCNLRQSQADFKDAEPTRAIRSILVNHLFIWTNLQISSI